MRRIALLVLLLYPWLTQAQMSHDFKSFVQGHDATEFHMDQFTQAIKTTEGYLVTESTGDLFANYRLGPGDFQIKAEFRINNLGGTAASFQLGNNYFGFDGRQNDFYLNGPIFGNEVRSIMPNDKLLQSGAWVGMEISRVDSTIEFKVDGALVVSADYEEGFPGKMGFHPIRAEIEVRQFAAKGNLIPVSLKAKGFSIPIIDIAHETDRQVVIDKQAGQYLGHPTTVILENQKSMLIVYPKGHGRGAIVMKRSEDLGKSWSKRLKVPDSWATSMEVPTLYPTVDKHGKKRIIMFSGLHPIRMAFSEDEGKTWSELEPIFDFGGIVAMGDMIQLKNGDYMAFFHDDGRFIAADHKVAPRFFVYSTVSKDGGLTWSHPQIVVAHQHMKLCEPGVVRSPDGNQIAMILRENGRNYNSAVIFSDDEGATWSRPVELAASLTGDRHQCHYAADGRLVVTFRDHTYDSPMQGDFVAWVGSYEDLVNQTEGQYRVRLMDNKSRWDCGYPAFEILPDGSFFAATYGKWEKDHAHYIMGTYFSLDELDAKMKENPLIHDVFVAGEEGYHTYRIPALWKSQAGTILAFAEGRESKSDHAANDIVLKRSTDNGATWGKLQVVAEQGDDCLNNPMIVEDENTGKLILMWQKYPEGYHERQVGVGYDSDTVCRSYIQYSSDQGKTWTSPKDITPMVKRPTWATSIAGGPGNGIQIKKGPYAGRLVMPFNQGPAGKWKIYAVYSDDGGESWAYGEIVFEKDQGNGNEVHVVELSDGRLMFNSRSASGKKLRKTAISTDGGVNWTGLIDDPNLIEPQCMGSIIAVKDPKDQSHKLVFSNPYTQAGRMYGTIQVSHDDGVSWAVNKCIYNGSYAYSSLADLQSGNIGLLFEVDDYGKISFLKTSLEWLIQKK